MPRGHSTVPYAELHYQSNFSFLDGASHPEELVEEAARLGLTALGITDHDGLYGIVRFAEAAKARTTRATLRWSRGPHAGGVGGAPRTRSRRRGQRAPAPHRRLRATAMEMWDHGDPLDSVRDDAFAAIAARSGVDVVATNNVHYATAGRRPLATAMAAV